MDDDVDVATFLEVRRDQLIEAAEAAVERAHVAHYEADGQDVTGHRLDTLLTTLVDCCRSHRVDTARSYANALAAERSSRGYPLLEVQTVINVLEEAVWRSIASELPASEQGYALALVSTVLGAVKDALARGYLAHTGSHPVPLHLEALFAGTEGTAWEV